jgi:hypothetical protein
MLTDDGKHLYVSWDEYHMLIERLALKVHNSGWAFDQILCLARGGMRPGDVLSRVFDKPLAIMSTSSLPRRGRHHPGPAGPGQVHHHAQGRACRARAAGGRPGRHRPHLKAVVDRLRGMPAIEELRAAVIWVKGVSSYTPDYFVETLPTSPWIHQPFEEYDGLRPEGLGQEVRSLSGRCRRRYRASKRCARRDCRLLARAPAVARICRPDGPSSTRWRQERNTKTKKPACLSTCRLLNCLVPRRGLEPPRR